MAPSLNAQTIATPIGPLTLLAAGETLVGAGFTGDAGQLRARLGPDLRDAPIRTPRTLAAISDAASAWLDGDETAWDTVAVRQPGGEFLQRSWRALRDVPAGETVSYTELATRSGNPAAFRAAAQACARNLIAPVVPCHRVIRNDGSLGGYYWGLPVKRWLLERESRAA